MSDKWVVGSFEGNDVHSSTDTAIYLYDGMWTMNDMVLKHIDQHGEPGDERTYFIAPLDSFTFFKSKASVEKFKVTS